MANRFGRNKKRRLEAHIRELQNRLYGPYGEYDGNAPKLTDDFKIISRSTVIEDDPSRPFNVELSMIALVDDRAMRRIFDLQMNDGGCQIDGRYVMIAQVDVPQIHYGRLVVYEPTFEIKAIQVRAPR